MKKKTEQLSANSKGAEVKRLAEARDKIAPWKKWGPYLSERQWGTVREDYSQDGNAWNYFSHDQARSRAYRWGEDGIAGISDENQFLCFALTLWNGKDPILKERLFGLTNSEGNHGEDVKEYYFYLDSTPTHSYMKYQYKYPQEAYPYDELVRTNGRLSRTDYEYELIDTGVFKDDRYFDVDIEYAKADVDDILIKITAHNRGRETANLWLLPTLWFRNLWSWDEKMVKPKMQLLEVSGAVRVVSASQEEMGEAKLFCEGNPEMLFTENETNNERIFHKPNTSPYVKDGFNNYMVHGKKDAVNPGSTGTKVAACYSLHIPKGETGTIRLRLVGGTKAAKQKLDENNVFDKQFESVWDLRKKEADEFYDSVIPPSLNKEEASIMRQAIAGMLWSKQYYFYDIDTWLAEHNINPYKSTRTNARNNDWHHMYNGDIISMPDKWEYPWYASWDLAFHVLALTLVDPDFGKQQLNLMMQGHYMHPNGQVPAYEWNFGDVNPPVLAWSTIFTYRLEKLKHQTEDIIWLKRNFQKLVLNFNWWVNRKDRSGRNVFEGGFLGLDNIGVFDRSSPLPTGGYLEQADGTAWMALFSQNMLEIATELAMKDEAYADMAIKFAEHFLWIASSMVHMGEDTGMWDDEDGFFYDVLRLPGGQAQRLKVRSMVGLLPFCAATSFDGELINMYTELGATFKRFLDLKPELIANIHPPEKIGVAGRRLASILDENRLRRVLAKMLDEEEFLSPYGIRSLSKFHERHPYKINVGDMEYSVSYLPGESDSGMFGGNSNWRGPIWMPVNGLILRALLHYYSYYGDDFKVECPTGSGNMLNLYQVAENIGSRLVNIFLKDKNGNRPVYGGTQKFQQDPNWKDNILFYEYFHGDNGAGLGASHQTGWTGIVARMMHLFATSNAEEFKEFGKAGAFMDVETTVEQ